MVKPHKTPNQLGTAMGDIQETIAMDVTASQDQRFASTGIFLQAKDRANKAGNSKKVTHGKSELCNGGHFRKMH